MHRTWVCYEIFTTGELVNEPLNLSDRCVVLIYLAMNDTFALRIISPKIQPGNRVYRYSKTSLLCDRRA
jgi:hypothetical protein